MQAREEAAAGGASKQASEQVRACQRTCSFAQPNETSAWPCALRFLHHVSHENTKTEEKLLYSCIYLPGYRRSATSMKKDESQYHKHGASEELVYIHRGNEFLLRTA